MTTPLTREELGTFLDDVVASVNEVLDASETAFKRIESIMELAKDAIDGEGKISLDETTLVLASTVGETITASTSLAASILMPTVLSQMARVVDGSRNKTVTDEFFETMDAVMELLNRYATKRDKEREKVLSGLIRSALPKDVKCLQP